MHRATLLIPENFAVADQTRDPLEKGENVKESFSHSFRKPFHPEKDRGKQLFPLERWTEVDFERQCARDRVTGGIFSVLLDFFLWPCLGWICFDWNGSYHLGSELSVLKSHTANILTGCPRKQKAHTLNADTQPRPDLYGSTSSRAISFESCCTSNNGFGVEGRV